MKKIFYLMLAVACFTLASCSKDEPGGTATQSQAGTWYGTFDLCDQSGSVLQKDPYNMGRVKVFTFNTAENSPYKMFVSDGGNFWNFQTEVVLDPTANAFQTNGDAQNLAYDCKVNIQNGKIIPNGGKQNNGSVTDSCEFVVSFSDDAAGTYYKFSGIRYSGLTENN